MTSPSLSTTCGTYLLNTLRDKALRVGLNPLSSPAGVQTYKTYAVNVLFRQLKFITKQLNLIYRTGKRAAPVRKWSPKRVLVQSELLLPSITLLLLQLLLLLSCFCWYLPTYYIGDKFFDDKFVDFFLWRCVPTRAMASPVLRFLHYTQRRTTDGRLLWKSHQLVAETST